VIDIHDLPRGSVVKTGTGFWESTITLTDEPVPYGEHRIGVDEQSGEEVAVPTLGEGRPMLVFRAREDS